MKPFGYHPSIFGSWCPSPKSPRPAVSPGRQNAPCYSAKPCPAMASCSSAFSGIDGRCLSVPVREEFLIDAKIRSHFRRIWTHVEGLCLRNDITIGFRHSFLLQHILSPGWNHHFVTKRVEPARIFEQLPTVGVIAQVDQPDLTH